MCIKPVVTLCCMHTLLQFTVLLSLKVYTCTCTYTQYRCAVYSFNKVATELILPAADKSKSCLGTTSCGLSTPRLTCTRTYHMHAIRWNSLCFNKHEYIGQCINSHYNVGASGLFVVCYTRCTQHARHTSSCSTLLIAKPRPWIWPREECGQGKGSLSCARNRLWGIRCLASIPL